MGAMELNGRQVCASGIDSTQVDSKEAAKPVAVAEGAAAQGIVVIGASNVSRGLANLVATVRVRSPELADLYVAAGHGRSYGANSRMWMRRLPSILWCGLWRALDRNGFGDTNAPAVPQLRAIVTDIGNDLLYGFSVDQVAAWVWESVARLAARHASIAITRLPLESIATVGMVRYRLLRTLYVPGCTLSLEALKEAAARLDAAILEIAKDHRATVIEQPGEWYGLDAIHVRRQKIAAVWQQACDVWAMPAARGPVQASVGEWGRLGRSSAEVRMLAGRMRFTPQPAVHLKSGMRVAMY